MIGRYENTLRRGTLLRRVPGVARAITCTLRSRVPGVAYENTLRRGTLRSRVPGVARAITCRYEKVPYVAREMCSLCMRRQRAEAALQNARWCRRPVTRGKAIAQYKYKNTSKITRATPGTPASIT